MIATTAVSAFAAALIVMAAVPDAAVIAGAFALTSFVGATWNVVTVSVRQQLDHEAHPERVGLTDAAQLAQSLDQKTPATISR